MFPRLPTTERLAYAGIGCLVVGGAAYSLFARGDKPAPIVFDNKPTASLEKPSQPPTQSQEVVVQVTGAVNKPGVFHLANGSRIDDAIKAAGGAKADAQMDDWNLAAKLIDSSQIFIQTKQAAHQSAHVASMKRPAPPRLSGTMPPLHVDVPKAYQGGPSAPSAYSGKLAVEPEPLVTNIPGTGKASSPDRTKKELPAPGSVDLNTATAEELQHLPGVGPSTAQKILDYRKEHGHFASAEELLAVKGIGPKKFDALRPYIRV